MTYENENNRIPSSATSAFYQGSNNINTNNTNPVYERSSFLPDNWKANLGIGNIDLNSISNYKNNVVANTNKPNGDSSDGISKPWYQDNDTMSAYTGLGSAFLQLAQLPEQMKIAKLQRKSLQQNYNQALEDSSLQKEARTNLNKSMFA